MLQCRLEDIETAYLYHAQLLTPYHGRLHVPIKNAHAMTTL